MYRRTGTTITLLALFSAAVAPDLRVRAQTLSGKPSTTEEPSTVTTKDEPQAKTDPKHTNRLIRATSPYLLQHAHNPVDWYEWEPEAFDKAKREDKPIFLSIGYAACHWCHVMEHESFEDDEVAKVLNDGFVSIKVDREERPDIDELYMAYTQARTGGGGWPMSVLMTSDGTPFHAGTYFPKAQLMQMLRQVSETWKSNRDQITGGAAQAKAFFARWVEGPEPAEGVLSLQTVDETAVALIQYFDRTLGGMSGGGGNKFPPSMAMDLLLRVHRRTGNAALFEAVDTTLDHMSRGGIYDHLGGGICRYSTDREWLVPHFEKMLYDQAMVSAIYLDGYLASKNKQYAAVAADIFDYVLEDLRSSQGAFYSSRDADSDGKEGKFYIWTVDEINSVLGKEEGELCCKYFDVTESGNWFERFGHAPPGPKNILHVSKPPTIFAKMHNMAVEKLAEMIKNWRAKLAAARAQRTPPALDDKVLTDWNGLMIASLAKGARVLDEPKYAEAAAMAAEFILANMQKDGRLLRTYRKGEARLTATLSDYAFFIEGLLNLYEATFDRQWLNEAERLADVSIRYYYDDHGGGFFFTASDGEKLLARSKQSQDNAIPSGNSVHAMNLLRLAILFDRKDLREKAESILRAFAQQASESPGAYERLDCAADFYHDRVKEIAIIGDPTSPDTKALLRTVYDRYLPNKVVVFAPDKVTDAKMPLLTGKGRIKDRPTAYVCENYRCRLPVNTPKDLAKELDAKPADAKSQSLPAPTP
ncbi:MAG: thioredoxin domain-containing protein [Planctomycetota bacterium]